MVPSFVRDYFFIILLELLQLAYLFVLYILQFIGCNKLSIDILISMVYFKKN